MSEQTPTTPQGQQVQVHVREDKMVSVYSNQCRLGSGPQAEEIYVDFATMVPSGQQQDAMAMDVTNRVYMNVFAAKRLALMLSQTIQRYEQQFGAIELNPQRRLKQG